MSKETIGIAHSPLPFRVDDADQSIGSIVDFYDLPVAQAQPCNALRRKANASFIVQACNAHYALLVAVQTLLDSSARGHPDSRGKYDEAVELAHRALAIVKSHV